MLRNNLIDLLIDLVCNADIDIREKKEIIKLLEKERIKKWIKNNFLY